MNGSSSSHSSAGPSGTQGSSISATQSAAALRASKRKVSHISRACLQCRRRKIRCDGGQPMCASCVHVGHDCQYSNQEDGRKAGAVQRSKVAQARRIRDADGEELDDLKRRNTLLRTRLLALERALSKRGVSVTEALEESPDLLAIDNIGNNSSDLQAKRDESEVSGSADTDYLPSSGAEDVVTDLDRLHLDDLGSSTLCHYGPTSALNHLAAAGPALQSPLSVDRQSHSPSAKETAGLPSSFGSQSAAFPWLQPKQDVEWDRNLPNLGITRDTHDSLVELCEAFFVPWVCILDVVAFKRDLQVCLGPSYDGKAPPSRTPFYSPLLHNMVLAMGARLWHGERVTKAFPPINQSAVPEDTAEKDLADMAADAFFARAKECFDVECERPMQSLVNGLLLMASFNSGRARPNLGYVLFNCAVASSHALGINIDCSDFVKKGIITTDTKRHRDNLFHTVYAQDKLWSMAVGRFTNISQDDHNIALPEIDAAYDQLPWNAPRIWQDIDANGLTLASGRPGYLSTCFHATIKLANIQNSVLRKFYSLRPDVRSPAQLQTISTLQAELVAWQKDLPECIRLDGSSVPPPHVLTMHLTYQYTILVLNRPLYQRLLHRDRNHTSVLDCDAAALKVVELLGLYDHFYSLNYAPLSSIQSTFVAGTVLLLKGLEAAKRDDDRQMTAALQGGAICITSLERFSLTWRTSLRISRILQSLFTVWLPDSIEHMRQNGWLAQENTDLQTSPTRFRSSEVRDTATGSIGSLTSSYGATAGQQPGFPQASAPYQSPNPAPGALNFSTWFNSPQSEQYQPSLDSILSSINDPGQTSLYPFANASNQTPPQSATPSSSDFLRQLLAQQQYQSQGFDYQALPPMPRGAPDIQYNVGSWSDPNSGTSEILSNFDFSIEAFNEMLKSSAAEAESV